MTKIAYYYINVIKIMLIHGQSKTMPTTICSKNVLASSEATVILFYRIKSSIELSYPTA